MREAELWARMNRVLGDHYAPAWAELVVLSDLEGRTVAEALRDGVACKAIWRAVAEKLELSESER
ncbi:MAG: DUF3046 domain-containing protein [Propionibacteriaceae bacterium]|jgi:hypothetical protein|nr:DUF3046 domain-containing protein [Propionibacteriaceae bacterium]